MSISVRTVLGDERVVEKVYEDGSVNCPWCWAAIRAPELPHCPNPACWANARWDPERLREARFRAERELADREAEERRRAEVRDWSAKYYQERREEEERVIREAIVEGYCPACFRTSRGRKKVKHRASTTCRAGSCR